MVRILVPSPDQIEILDSGTAGAGAMATNLLLTSVSEVRQLKPEQVAQKFRPRSEALSWGYGTSP